MLLSRRNLNYTRIRFYLARFREQILSSVWARFDIANKTILNKKDLLLQVVVRKFRISR